MHGGAPGSGAPPGERNGMYKHGLRTRKAVAERRALQALIRSMRGDACKAMRSKGTIG
jgi:hypothetical protein